MKSICSLDVHKDSVYLCILSEFGELIEKVLPKREFEIIKLRFGLMGNKPLTQREVAKKLGISRSYISRLETKAMEKIKEEVNKRGIFS